MTSFSISQECFEIQVLKMSLLAGGRAGWQWVCWLHLKSPCDRRGGNEKALQRLLGTTMADWGHHWREVRWDTTVVWSYLFINYFVCPKKNGPRLTQIAEILSSLLISWKNGHAASFKTVVWTQLSPWNVVHPAVCTDTCRWIWKKKIVICVTLVMVFEAKKDEILNRFSLKHFVLRVANIFF